jgi:threonine dehydratase
LALACQDAEIVVVEPEGWDDMRRSLELGEIVPVDADAPPTACDALQTPLVSPLTFGVLKARGAYGVSVSEAEVRAAVRFAWHELQLRVEPGGSAALAAVLAGKVGLVPGTVVMLTGGNMDPALHAQWVR